MAGALALSALGAVVPAGAGAIGVYVSNNGSNSVSVFGIGAGGVLAPMPCNPATTCQTGTNPEGVAVDPSGSHVYVVNNGIPGSVSVFAIGAGGVLSPVACDPATICKTGNSPQGVAVDPSGSHLYVTNESSNSVSVFAIGAGGVLARVSCDTATSCKTGSLPFGVAVDPSGSHVYVTNNGSPGSVSVFAIGPGGVLSRVTCDPATSCTTGSSPEAAAVDPSGSHLYVTNDTGPGSISVFSIGAGGVLTPVTCDPTTSCKTGGSPDLFALAVSPDRGPAAAFSASAAVAGSASRLDGSASSSPDYPIASYFWAFGDGQTQTSALPAVQHTYAKPGSYTVTLAVTDQAGCSQAFVYTGQTASCNGSAKALASHTITVPRVTVGKETISPKAFRAKPSGPSVLAAKNSKHSYGAKVSYTLNGSASVRFTVQRPGNGRKVKHGKKTACRRPTKKNQRKKKCTRYVTLKGSFTRAGLAGTNTFRFTGRLKAKRLRPGKYRLVATPTVNGKTGRAASASFRIVP